MAIASDVGRVLGASSLVPAKKALAIVGTNASGKSDLALAIAERLGGEIVSADSRQVYRGFDLCSGKVPKDVARTVPHHLIDVVDAPNRYTLHDYLQAATKIIGGISDRAGLPILVGGTPLYAEAVIRGYRLVAPPPDEDERAILELKTSSELASELEQFFPGEAQRIGLSNHRRLVRAVERARRGISYPDAHQYSPTHDWLILGVTWPFPELEARIQKRLKDRLEAGMVEEIVHAVEEGVPRRFLWDLGLEYRYVLRYQDGEFQDEDDFERALARAIRRFARRQLAWFRRWEDIRWLEGSEVARLSESFRLTEGWLAENSGSVV